MALDYKLILDELSKLSSRVDRHFDAWEARWDRRFTKSLATTAPPAVADVAAAPDAPPQGADAGREVPLASRATSTAAPPAPAAAAATTLDAKWEKQFAAPASSTGPLSLSSTDEPVPAFDSAPSDLDAVVSNTASAESVGLHDVPVCDTASTAPDASTVSVDADEKLLRCGPVDTTLLQTSTSAAAATTIRVNTFLDSNSEDIAAPATSSLSSVLTSSPAAAARGADEGDLTSIVPTKCSTKCLSSDIVTASRPRRAPPHSPRSPRPRRARLRVLRLRRPRRAPPRPPRPRRLRRAPPCPTRPPRRRPPSPPRLLHLDSAAIQELAPLPPSVVQAAEELSVLRALVLDDVVSTTFRMPLRPPLARCSTPSPAPPPTATTTAATSTSLLTTNPAAPTSFLASAALGAEEGTPINTTTSCSTDCPCSDADDIPKQVKPLSAAVGALESKPSSTCINAQVLFEGMQQRYITTSTPSYSVGVLHPYLATKAHAAHNRWDGIMLLNPIMLQPLPVVIADREPEPYFLNFELVDISPNPPWPVIYVADDSCNGDSATQICFNFLMWITCGLVARKHRPPWPPPVNCQLQVTGLKQFEGMIEHHLVLLEQLSATVVDRADTPDSLIVQIANIPTKPPLSLQMAGSMQSFQVKCIIYKFLSCFCWRFQYGLAIAQILDQRDMLQGVSILVQQQQLSSLPLYSIRVSQQLNIWESGPWPTPVSCCQNLFSHATRPCFRSWHCFIYGLAHVRLRHPWSTPIQIEASKIQGYVLIIDDQPIWVAFLLGIGLQYVRCFRIHNSGQSVVIQYWKPLVKPQQKTCDGEKSRLLQCPAIDTSLYSSTNTLDFYEVMNIKERCKNDMIYSRMLISLSSPLTQAKQQLSLDITLIFAGCGHLLLYFQECISGFHANGRNLLLAVSFAKITTIKYLQASWDPG